MWGGKTALFLLKPLPSSSNKCCYISTEARTSHRFNTFEWLYVCMHLRLSAGEGQQSETKKAKAKWKKSISWMRRICACAASKQLLMSYANNDWHSLLSLMPCRSICTLWELPRCEGGSIGGFENFSNCCPFAMICRVACGMWHGATATGDWHHWHLLEIA